MVQKAVLSCFSYQAGPSQQPWHLAGEMLSNNFILLLLLYLFEVLHEWTTTLFQVLVFHIFSRNLVVIERKRLLPPK